MKLQDIKSVTEAVKMAAPTKPVRKYNPNARIVELNNIDIWDEHGLEEADIEVEFDYEAPSYSNHPYGEGTAREDHGAVIGITEIRLLNDVNVRDMDDNVEKVLAKGTDLMKEKTAGGLPLVSKANLKWLEDQVAEKMLG
jgi:hypothetical protein